ncbi:homeobox protein Hox-D9a-like [Actinia tenebrosa]|uniref:Homeobox protein Hox-D9a-like n=1 Tax=Actinia tenebrosa TaxID=6105 RepID=A0A6P8HJC0_ACTTE|nr:homeobox protein Hox-D9a-like [Actinia tenebrosa]
MIRVIITRSCIKHSKHFTQTLVVYNIMSNENSITQSRNLPFSIENILREDFPPKSRLAFPPKHYYLPENHKDGCPAAHKGVTWIPLARFHPYWPLYYGQLMCLPTYRAIPTESNTLDSEKKEVLETCLDCNPRSKEHTTTRISESQDENIEQEEVKSCDSADENPSEDKEYQSRKRRSRSQFTPMQLKYLEKYYSNHSYLSRDERTVLAQALNMTELQIRNWFQNKRYHKKNKLKTK